MKEQSIQFYDKSINNPTSWLWNFGDNTTRTAQSPSKIYSTSGSYTVSLTVTNSFGDDTKTATNCVTVYETVIIAGRAFSHTESIYYVYVYQGTDVVAAKNNTNYATNGLLYNWTVAKAACPPGWFCSKMLNGELYLLSLEGKVTLQVSLKKPEPHIGSARIPVQPTK